MILNIEISYIISSPRFCSFIEFYEIIKQVESQE